LMRKLGHTLKYLNLPNWIEWRIRAVYVRLFSAEYMNNPPSYSDKSSKYYDDFNKIRHHVLLYPELYKLN
ncbi:MAG: hypothetical protein U9Q22_00340, partial [Candidatus Altiarchaeota archaeon]|nr:hypothetical protein [Candidatus Altiarchaeota archaeon]